MWFVCPTADSSLDLSTKLRLTEAEVAILQREVAELITDRSTFEAQATQYKVHWMFAMQTCGRLVEERDNAVSKFEVGWPGSGRGTAGECRTTLSCVVGLVGIVEGRVGEEG